MSGRTLVSFALVAAGFAAGLVLTGRLAQLDVEQATAQPAAAAPPGEATLGEATLGAPPVLAQAPGGAIPGAVRAGTTLPDFTGVAERTVPAVVNISSVQVVNRPNSPFANDPFFRNFFGDADMFGSRPSLENSLGSGVVISEDGYILTNNHVVVGESGGVSLRQLPDITVTLGDQRELRAEIIGIDRSTDLALLKIDAEALPTIPWGDSTTLQVAEWVLAIGNPFQLSQSVSLGIISALGRRDVGISAYEDFIQTDAAINPGNSGGALVNARGELVGINTAIFSQSGGYQGIGFAVPSSLAREVVDELIEFGEVRRGSIGYVELAPLTTLLAAELGAPDADGLLVTRLRRDSPAYVAGLRPGDIVVAFGGAAVGSDTTLSRLVQDAEVGSTVVMTVVRDGGDVDLRIPIQ
jgi:Do/DeqQ family serine protease